MPRRFQFSLKALMRVVTATALAAGIISWQAPETRRVLVIWVQVFALLFGMFLAVVLALAVVFFCFNMCRRMVSRGKCPHSPLSVRNSGRGADIESSTSARKNRHWLP